MAILRHRSICALSALILAAVCALCVVSPGCALAAEVNAQTDDANSWRFADGQLLTVPGLDGISLLSSESYTEFDATLTPNGYATVNRQTGSQRLIPGAISKGIDVSEHNRTIDWEAAKNDGVKFAIIRVGYGNDLTNQDDEYWLRNVSEFGIVRLRGNVVRGFQLHPCSFGPNDPVTREQLATLFSRYASVVDGLDTSSDCSAMDSKNGATEVSAYAREAMGWAVDTGLITGVNGTDLEPVGTAWRASMAEMVKRYSSF